MIGLPGDVENQLGLPADHSDLCRFDPNLEVDKDNYRLVERNLKELCQDAIAHRSTQTEEQGKEAKTEQLVIPKESPRNLSSLEERMFALRK